MIRDYYTYLVKNPQSLITKIYGLVTVRFKDLDLEQDIILMENLCLLPSCKTLQVYDLKGSTYNRQVI